MSSLLTAGNALSDEGVAALLVDMAMLGVTDPAQVMVTGNTSTTTSPTQATSRTSRRGHNSPRTSNSTSAPVQPRSVGRRTFWVVYHGKNPGVYGDWLLANPQISGFSGAIHEKFPSEAAANAAYRFALSRGLVRGTNTPVTTPPPPYSAISDELDATATARAISPGVAVLKFYVVNPGRRPGIYASLVEATMAVVGVPGGQWSMHRSFRAACLAWARVVASNSIDIRPGE